MRRWISATFIAAFPSPALAQGGDFIALGVVQVVVVVFCAALLRILPKTPNRNHYSVLGLVCGVLAYWLALFVFYWMPHPDRRAWMLDWMIVLSVPMPIVGYVVGLALAYKTLKAVLIAAATATVIFGIAVALIRSFPSRTVTIEIPPSVLEAGLAAWDKIIDEEFAKLRWEALLAAPKRMEANSTATVEFALEGRKSLPQLTALLEAAGNEKGAQVLVSKRMEARLTGSAFKIVPVTPEMQVVSAVDTTKWRWEVTAERSGEQRLHLSLNTQITIDGRETAKSVRTWQRQIEVQTSTWNWVKEFIASNWHWLATTIVIPLVVWWWKSRKRTTANT